MTGMDCVVETWLSGFVRVQAVHLVWRNFQQIY